MTGPHPQIHPICSKLPAMSADEFAELRASIRDRGLIEPIELYEGQVLDGRHRLQACIDEHCEPRFVEFSGGDPWLRVWDRNGARREWSGGAGQKYAVWRSLKAGSDEWAARQKSIQDAANAARSEKAKARPRNDDGTLTSAPTFSGRTGTRGSSNKGSKSKAAAAGVDRGTVEKFERVANVAPDLAEKIQTGETTLTKAEREVKERAREAKREQNRAAIVAASKTEQALGVYSSIVIDPPWDWGDEGDQDQLGRSRPTYGTMSIDALLDLPVGQYAAQDAHLYLWITNRSLPKGFALLERWSFRYVTCITWAKPSFGMGNYFRGQTEHVLFAVRGSLPLKRKDVGTLFSAPRGPRGHSSKPSEFYGLVESCSPGPYLEMFARGGRADWTSWGAEANAA